MSFSSPSMRCWIQAFCAGAGDVHELDADVAAVGAAQDAQDLAHRRGLQAEHLVDEDRAVEVGLGEAVGLGPQLLVHLALGEPERVEVGDEVAHHAIGADQHQGANRILGRAHRGGDRQFEAGGLRALADLVAELALGLAVVAGQGGDQLRIAVL